MGNSTPTRTHTHVTPIPALTGMGLYGYGCGLPVTSHHTATSSLTTPTLNQCPCQRVFGSLVRSSFLTPRVINRNRNRSFYFQIPKKTGPNRCGPVHIGFFAVTRPVKTVTGLNQSQTGSNRSCRSQVI